MFWRMQGLFWEMCWVCNNLQVQRCEVEASNAGPWYREWHVWAFGLRKYEAPGFHGISRNDSLWQLDESKWDIDKPPKAFWSHAWILWRSGVSITWQTRICYPPANANRDTASLWSGLVPNGCLRLLLKHEVAFNPSAEAHQMLTIMQHEKATVNRVLLLRRRHYFRI